MEYKTLQYGRMGTFKATCKEQKLKIKENQPVDFRYVPSIDKYTLSWEESAVEVVFKSDSDYHCLNNLIVSGLPCIIQFIHQYKIENEKNKNLVFQYHQFPKKLNWQSENTDIGIDDKIFEDVRRCYLRNYNTNDEVPSFFKEQFLLRHANSKENYFFLSVGTDDIKEITGAFSLCGKSIIADIKNIKDKWQITRIRSNKTANKYPIYIADSKLSFCDISIATRTKIYAQKQVQDLANAGKSILDTWKKYNLLELEQLKNKIETIGFFEYESIEQTASVKYKFKLKDSKRLEDKLYALDKWLADQENIELAISEELPDVIKNPRQLEFVQEEKEKKQEKQSILGHGSIETIVCRSEEIHLHFSEEIAFPEKGFLFYSYIGDFTSMKRRYEAQNEVFASRNPMPQLSLLLEGVPTETRQIKKMKVFSPKLIEKFKDRPLTSTQKEAIQIALDTPDIAIIQGPPGTGKTTVITAIIERLAEEANLENDLNSLVLVSSFQHDAVINATERITVNDIPAIKLGRRANMIDTAKEIAENWIEKQQKHISQIVEDLPVSAIYKEVRNYANSYFLSPGNAQQTLEILTSIKQVLPSNILPLKLQEKLNTEIVSIQSEVKRKELQKDSYLIHLVRGLRTNEIAFLDDGLIKTRNLQHYLEKQSISLQKEQRTTLQKIIDTDIDDCDLSIVATTQQLQSDLLEQFIPDRKSSIAYVEKRNIRSLLSDILNAVQQKVLTTEEGVAGVLAEYYNDLLYDKNGVMDMLAHYTTVLAASCQQSASPKMARAKNNDLVYDTVIIDEAARATPLDLLIPMSQARRRIILVGDHRQLPHMLEPSLEKDLDKTIGEQAKQNLKMCMFEKLFISLKNLEKKTNTKRVITLDCQFRTHPILGEFVSDNFYADDGIKISSGTSEEALQHKLIAYTKSGKNVPAAWIDVPHNNDTKEERPGRSLQRPAEAKVIAEELCKIRKENPSLSIGVITFYSAQRDLIKKRLAQKNIGKDILVGSVDAFQGREFDIVFLSMTRSNTIKPRSEKEIRRKYGFITFVNRVCVAMSRQKCLLIVVGDMKMTIGDKAEEAIPHIVKFRKLCEKEGIVRNYKEVFNDRV